MHLISRPGSPHHDLLCEQITCEVSMPRRSRVLAASSSSASDRDSGAKCVACSSTVCVEAGKPLAKPCLFGPRKPALKDVGAAKPFFVEGDGLCFLFALFALPLLLDHGPTAHAAGRQITPPLIGLTFDFGATLFRAIAGQAPGTERWISITRKNGLSIKQQAWVSFKGTQYYLHTVHLRIKCIGQLAAIFRCSESISHAPLPDVPVTSKLTVVVFRLGVTSTVTPWLK